MNGILTRWRQFGRRYFWSHLLWGIVAAGFGLPAIASSTESVSPAKTTASAATNANFKQLALLEGNRRPSFSVDYWHQHAIRTVIRHLSFTTAPQALSVVEANASLDIQHQALLDTLSILLMRESQPPAIIRHILSRTTSERHAAFNISIWLSQVQGIRAGPQSLS